MKKKYKKGRIDIEVEFVADGSWSASIYGSANLSSSRPLP